MSKKQLNILIRQMIVGIRNASGNGGIKVVDAIDYVITNLSDPRVTRQRVCGNISALCCKFCQLSCVNGYLI